MKLFKPRKKVRRSLTPIRVHDAPSGQVSSIVEIAIETWRVGDRLKKLQVLANKEGPTIGFSIERIQHILKEMGVEVKDPAGEIYHDGMGLDVLTFDYGPGELPTNRIVQETVSPAVYYNGQLIKMAKVIVGSAGGRNPNAQNHD